MPLAFVKLKNMRTVEDFIGPDNEDMSDVDEIMGSSLSNISDLSLQMESVDGGGMMDNNQGTGEDEEGEEEEEKYNCAASEIMSNAVCSTPVKIRERLSVSLMDVSDVGCFPLGEGGHRSVETLQSSHSTVAKSRDSGYNRSASSLSVASSSDHPIASNFDMKTKIEKCIKDPKKSCSEEIHADREPCNDKIKCHTAHENYRKLREELEFKDVMISALQESNNSLRMKWADAQNKISELRMLSVQHCTCCPRKSNRWVDVGGWGERRDLINDTDNSAGGCVEMLRNETITNFMNSASRIEARRALAAATSMGREVSSVKEFSGTGLYHQTEHHEQVGHGEEEEKQGSKYSVCPVSACLATTLCSLPSTTSPLNSSVTSRSNIYLPGDDPLDRVKIWQESFSSLNSNEEAGNVKKINKDVGAVRSWLGGSGDSELKEGTKSKDNKWERGVTDWAGLQFRVFEAHNKSSSGVSRPHYSINKPTVNYHHHHHLQYPSGERLLSETSPLRRAHIPEPIPCTLPTTATTSVTTPARRYLKENNSYAPVSNRNNIILSTTTIPGISAANNYHLVKHANRGLHECLREADELAKELSKGLAKIPADLENIKSLTDLCLRRRCSHQDIN